MKTSGRLGLMLESEFQPREDLIAVVNRSLNRNSSFCESENPCNEGLRSLLINTGDVSSSQIISGDVIKLPSDALKFFGGDAHYFGTRWAVLIAGSNGYWIYRHQG